MREPDMDVGVLSLRNALGSASFVATGDIVASRFVCDSRCVRPGDVFFALQGWHFDGRRFIDDAIRAGAAAIVVERPIAHVNIPQCVVTDPRAAFAHVCLTMQGRPQDSLKLAGVTGTNGKTTTTWLLHSILEMAGHKSGLLGTIDYSDGVHRSPASLTTPTSEQLATLLSKMKRQQASHCVMELSSHALHQSRCASLQLSTAAVTNVTQDHFDYHGDFRNYLLAKSRIATLLHPGGTLLLGIDDFGCRELQSKLKGTTDVLAFGFNDTAELRAEVLEQRPDAQKIRLSLLSSSMDVTSSLVGRHNALNLLAAAGMAEQLRIDPAAIVSGLEQVAFVPGRMERIVAGQNFTVLVDYAHTPDGLAQSVATARSLTSGRVLLVFGAGGDRDAAKRPLMAKAAESADLIVVTTDNPRSEPPQRIIEEICAGFCSTAQVQTCIDRQQAFRMATRMAQPGDVVLFAGRGHESMQQVGNRSISFDDRKVARQVLLERLLDSQPSATTAIPA